MLSGRYSLTRQRGMTLLEVMVALFIFAVTGTAIMKAASEHLFSVGQVEQITVATWVANNQLNQLHYQPKWPPKNKAQGAVEMSGKTWYWQQKVEATNDSDLRAVTVSVGLDPSNAEQITSVTTFIAKPTRSGS